MKDDLTIYSTTDAVTARDSVFITPRRSRHAGRWRGVKNKKYRQIQKANKNCIIITLSS